MENFLPFIIVLIIGALLSGKKKKDSSGQNETKPFTAQQERPNDSFRKIKDMSSEMYREIQKEMAQETERQRPTQQRTVSHSNATSQNLPVQNKEGRTPTKRSSRHRPKNVIGRTEKLQQSKINTKSLMPKSDEDLIKGVIFSEIFGPPKSKR